MRVRTPAGRGFRVPVRSLALAGAARARCGRRSRSSRPATATRSSRRSRALVAEGDPRAIAVLEALGEGELQVAGKRRADRQGRSRDRRGSPARPSRRCRRTARTSVVNNRVRRELDCRAGGAAARRARSRGASRRGEGACRRRGRGAAAAGAGRRSTQESDPAIKPTLELDRRDLELKGGDREAPARRDPHARPRRATRASRRCCSRCSSSDKDGTFAEPDEDDAARGAGEPARGRGPPRRGASCAGLAFAGVRLGSILLLAALGPRDHLRPDGRHQHGARRADHDRRVHHLRRAEPLPRARARRVRLVPAVRGAGGVRRRRRWSAWRSSAASSACSTAARSRRCSRPGASA